MNKAKPSRGLKLMTYNVIRKISGATREDSSIFSDKFKRHYQQVRD